MSRPWIEADWPAPAGVRAITTWRGGAGVSAPPFDTFNLGLRSGDEAGAVAENRRQLAEVLALPAAPRWLRQVHGVGVLKVGAGPAPDEEAEADASVTGVPGEVLAILTADCLPVVLASRDGREIGVAHAGWRGLAAGVLENAIAAMRAAPEDLMAWLGPAAGPRAYEIGEEVRETFVAHDPVTASAFIATRPGHWNADLYALARRRLAMTGVAAEAIHGGNHCTISEAGDFFSHRRDGRSGRIATLAWIAG